MLAEQGVGFVDCGVSGGVWGLENGYALMCGGTDEDVAKVQPAFDALKPEGDVGFVHAGRKPGAGHFAKMVHNGIEYAIMQAYAEGWELLETVDMVEDVPEVFRSWRRARSSVPGCSTCWSRARRGRPPRQDRAATPTTPARAGGPSRPASRTPSPTPAITARSTRASSPARTTARR